MKSHVLPRLVLVGFVLVLAAALVLSGCTRTPATQPTADQSQPKEEPTATVAFKVELPVTATPTQQVANEEGTPLPTYTPAPTNTPRPTKTPWPTKAPTSAPVDDPNMVYVPGGEFAFGYDGGPEDQSPAQTLTVDSFNIDKYPVTNAEYRLFVDDTGHRLPRHWKDGEIPAGKEDHPVVWVSWEDASAYAEWAGKRLPTEAEWEKAARGEQGSLYPWGEAFDIANCNSREAGVGDTTAVGSYAGGESGYGALDMSGNVWEWTSDWYDAYRGSVYSLDRYGETYKVLRGGSWFDGSDMVSAVARNSGKPTFTFSTIGFRCAK